MVKSNDMANTDAFMKAQLKDTPATFRSGDVVKVHQRIKEGEKERTQIFEGLVIARKHGKGVNATFTVRKIAAGVGVEKTYLVHSPLVEKVEVVKETKTRRNKLYFVRDAKGKKLKTKKKIDIAAVQHKEMEAVPQEEMIAEAEVEVSAEEVKN